MSIRIAIKKFFIWSFIAAILGGGFLGIFSSAPKALAQDYSKYNSNIFSPVEAGDWSANKITHTFRINSISHSVTAQKSFQYYLNDISTGGGCWKVSDSDYFNISSEYYICISASGSYTKVSVLRKATTDEARTLDSKRNVNDGKGNFYVPYTNPTGVDYEKEYINYLNTNPDYHLQSTFEKSDKYFSDATYSAKVNCRGDSAPTIVIPAESAFNRPELTFKLTKVQRWSGAASAENNNFYFSFADSPDGPAKTTFKQAAIKLGQDGKGQIVNIVDASNPSLDAKLAIINIDEATWWSCIINQVYNAKGADESVCGSVTTYPNKTNPAYPNGEVPNRQCINVSEGGWLKKWGVEITSGSVTNPTGEEANTCGVITSNFVTKSIAQVLCSILNGIGEMGEWLINTLGIDTVINAYHSTSQHLVAGFGIEKAHAEDPNPGITQTPDKSSIKDALNGNPPWILASWKVVLGLANVFVVIVLIFLAIANITRIQYDTYAIKKSLPTLIIGIILANFSILITKMLVDATNVLTATFTGGDPGTMVSGMITSIVPTAGKPGFMAATPSLGSLLLAIFFAFFAIVIFLILGFLFYIRYIVILTLTIAAPLAFVAMAFPPTQGLFKQWSSWYFRFIFMKPISIFLLWLASMVLGTSAGNNITAWAIAVFLGLAAIIVPFKLGGAVMGAWGKAGKWMASPATNAAKGAYERKRDLAKAAMSDRFNNTRFGRYFERGRKYDEMRTEDYKKRAENRLSDRAAELKERDQRFERTTHGANRAKSRLETRENLNTNAILNGGEAEALKEEEIDLINAKGNVEQTLSEAERGVREGRGHAQNLREMEVGHAKNQLEIEKQERDEDIREGHDVNGLLNNLTAAQISEITGLNIADATTVNMKARYLGQANRLTLVKERASKRASQDVQIVAERDSRNNNDLRQTMQELLDANRGIDSTYNLDGTLTVPGTTERVSWTQARESAEQLRYRATTAEGAERTRLETAAQYFDQQAATFQAANATYDATMVTDLDNSAINYEAQANAAEAALRAANPTATAQEIAQVRAPHEARADRAMNASQLVRGRLGQQVDYRNYLTNNLAGRRQKIINPDIADEVHTQVISTPAPNLYQDILNNEPNIGSGEARTNQQGIYHVLNGRMNEVDESGARAAMIQIGAIHEVMKTARHGDSKGLNEIQGFMQVMEAAGRPNFKVAAARRALGSMNPTLQANMTTEATRQMIASGLLPGGSTWATISPQLQETALQNLNLEQLDLKSQQNSGQRDFVDRFMDQVEADEGLSLETSAGSRSARTRPVDPRRFIENQP